MHDQPPAIQHPVPPRNADQPATALIGMAALAVLARIGRVFLKRDRAGGPQSTVAGAAKAADGAPRGDAGSGKPGEPRTVWRGVRFYW